MTLNQLRAHAIGATLFRPTTLPKAVERLGFVQADPIRSPARAQDLILRHRVDSYRAGDLERRYASLGIEEDFLYAYGFMARRVWEDLHPRSAKHLTAAERRVLDVVTAHRKIHPKDLEGYFGRTRQVNAWGGYSKATTQILHSLHHRGLLRVVGRENGIRLYEPVGPAHKPAHDPAERLRRLVLVIAGLLAPVSVTSLRFALTIFSKRTPFTGRLSIVPKLLDDGDLESAVVDGNRYVWPAGRAVRTAPAEIVRFLAPFDPVVWDRRRFEHLWGWAYRFEAYTVPAMRKMGYYAMPVLWRDRVVGWVNVSNARGNFTVDRGFAGPAPDDFGFETEYHSEVERFRSFLPARAG